MAPLSAGLAVLARKHNTYIVCPLDRRDGDQRLNTAVLIDRSGAVAGLAYSKVFPYWSEFDKNEVIETRPRSAGVRTDFGRVRMTICFDADFPEVWAILANQDAELVIWPSAYSAGTTLQAHALMNHFYIVTSTQTRDCIVYDINGTEILYEVSPDTNISRVTVDLDRCIFHENFNMEKRELLLQEHANDIELEAHLL